MAIKIGTTVDSLRKRGFCSQYITVYDAFTTKPDGVRSGYYNTLCKDLYNNGLWSVLDILRVYGAHTNGAGEALLNWISPSLYAATAFNAPTFTIDKGFTFNGTTQYINNNWVPSVSGINYIANSASQIMYIRTNFASNVGHGTGHNANGKCTYILPRTLSSPANKGIVKLNNDSWLYGEILNSSGMYVNTRNDATNLTLYKNSLVIVTGIRSVIGAPTISLYCGAVNDDGVATDFRADQVFFEAWGAGLSQAQVTLLTTIVNTLATSLGVNVF